MLASTPLSSAARKITVAVIQAASTIGRVGRNAQAVDQLLQGVKGRGINFVLLPEMYLQGYSFDHKVVWPLADRITDVTQPTREAAPASFALAELSARHGVHIGTTVLERTPEHDFRNTFVVGTPSGELHTGRWPKSYPANFEAYIFSGRARPSDSRFFDLPVGAGGATVRFGVSIGAETTRRDVRESLAAGAPDVLLLPHVAPGLHPRLSLLGAAPVVTTGPVPGSAWDRDAYHDSVLDSANCFAIAYHRPALFANPIGPWSTVTPAPYLRPFEALLTRGGGGDEDLFLLGGSRVAEGRTGHALAACDEGEGAEEGIAVASIDLPEAAAAAPAATAAAGGSSLLTPQAAAALEASQSLPPLLRAAFPANEAFARATWYETPRGAAARHESARVKPGTIDGVWDRPFTDSPSLY